MACSHKAGDLRKSAFHKVFTFAAASEENDFCDIPARPLCAGWHLFRPDRKFPRPNRCCSAYLRMRLQASAHCRQWCHMAAYRYRPARLWCLRRPLRQMLHLLGQKQILSCQNLCQIDQEAALRSLQQDCVRLSGISCLPDRSRVPLRACLCHVIPCLPDRLRR